MKQLACKKIRIDSINGIQTFEVGKQFEKFIISEITVDLVYKVVMIKDKNNFEKIFHFIYSEIDLNPSVDNSILNARNLII